MRKFEFAMCLPGRCLWRLIGSIAILALAIALVACGGDSGISANDDNVSSSSVIQSGDSHEGSSNSKKADPGTESGMTSSSKKDGGSESAMTSSSSSSAKAKSSSSVILSSSRHSGLDPESSSGKQSSSSSKGIATNSSSSRNDNQKSSSSAKSAMTESSSSEKNSVLSSSRDYTPYAHDTCLAGNWNVHKDAYKTFIDPRNGRSYYYYTAVSSKTGKSVTVMAENLNIGDMVLGENDQNDDSKIERYCYNNDTTYCDEFGGLYQWAEMMQLPSRCNTESCADLILPNHQGICPDGWRLFTWDDYLIIRQYEDKYDEGISGLRSQCFNGTNTSGFSLVGAGYRTEKGAFESLANFAIWNYPQEYGGTSLTIVNSALVSKLGEESPAKNSAGSKLEGVSVRCVKLE